jgi:hypothetical protein
MEKPKLELKPPAPQVVTLQFTLPAAQRIVETLIASDPLGVHGARRLAMEIRQKVAEQIRK